MDIFWVPSPYTVYTSASDRWGICGSNTSNNGDTVGTQPIIVYNNGDVIAPLFNSINSASDGNNYYGLQDINNPYTSTINFPSDPGNLWHTITFDPVSLPGGGTYPIKVAFDYYTIGFDGNDYIGWEVIWDNDTIWNGINYSSNSNTGSCTTEEFTAPSGATHVRLRVAAKQNGGTDFGAFDNFRVFLDIGDLTPPTITSINAIDPNTLTITTSEEVTNASNILNYSGINVNSATVNLGGDTITLNLSSPLVNGQYTDVYVSGLTDVASNIMTNDTLSVIFNNTDASAGLTFTEIMYNDPGTYNNLAYIEIYNNSLNTISLGGLRIDNAISYVFPEFDLQAGDYAILAKEAYRRFSL